MDIIFLITLFLIIYPYVIYPVLLYLLVKLISLINLSKEDKPLSSTSPNVGIICAMYNEEKVAQTKINNFIHLNYPNLRLYIGSDGSTDRTEEILAEYKEYDNIKIYLFSRRGKVYVINDLMKVAQEDILVFTDANSMFDIEAINNLVKMFSDPRVGTVCGRLVLIDGHSITGEGFYWKFETLLKKLENNIGCVMGGNGAIYAVRKELLRPLPVNTINDDFTNSMRVLEKGYEIKFAQDAIAYEQINHSDSVEFKRHVRDGAGHYRAMVYLYRLLNPFKPKVFFTYVSHRVIRWMVPFLMLLGMLLPLFINLGIVGQILYRAEIIFYVLVLVGWVTKTRLHIFYVPYYFVYINIALMIGFIRSTLHMQKVMWSSTER